MHWMNSRELPIISTNAGSLRYYTNLWLTMGGKHDSIIQIGDLHAPWLQLTPFRTGKNEDGNERT